MKRIVLSLLIPLSCCLTAWGQINDDCSKGDKEAPSVNDPTKEQVGEASSSWQLSYDPNEIIGPAGYDSVRWVSINDVLNYTILFENDPEFATAAAQKVDVRFDFPNKAWMKGFGIGGYSFANMSFPVAKPSNAYQQRIDLRDSLGYYVDLIGGLDVARQQGFWTFSTIDPETGYAPWQAERGLLPVNDSTHVGEGAVTFQLKPYEGLHTGDTISIQACIVFDQNDTIPTNRWTNKIDAGNPNSKIAPLLSPQEGDEPITYNLTFTATDDEGGSGIRHLLLYLANHNGIYEEIDTVAVDTVLAFPVEPGKQYKLYSIAVDNAGNREPAKMEPDVILNFNQAPTDIALSDSIFQDDLEVGGFIGKLTSVDSEDEKTFTYALAEGEGAIHNDLFQITDDQLQIKNSFKCVDDEIYKVRISTTDDGGLSFSKAFTLNLNKVLVKPEADTLSVSICEGETCLFHGVEYDKTGFYTYTQSNDYMCDSVFVLNLSVLKPIEKPIVTVEGTHTLVSSAAKGNQWFREDGTPIEGATEQKFTPTEDGIYYVAASNGACYSEPSMMYRVQLTDNVELTMNLLKGWNWVSSNLADKAQQEVMNFLAPVKDKADQIIGFAQGLMKDPDIGWAGNLKQLSPEAGYKLHVTENVTNTWRGLAATPENTPITLYKGWNWIGYVPNLSKDVNEALSELQPTAGDVIKGFDNFAIYDGSQWVGTLSTMRLGEGYMYQAQQEKTFVYSPTRVFVVDDDNEVKRVAGDGTDPWMVVAHEYPDNMTLIAQVFVGENPAPDGLYTIGAFVNDECRGIGQYVNGKLFMTVHGDISSKGTVGFKAYDNATGAELHVTETCDFANVMKGSLAAPYPLHVTATDKVEALQAAYNIYPNPVRNRLYINGNTDDIKAVSIISVAGARESQTVNYNVSGIDVSGLADGAYVVVITTNQGDATYKIVKMK